MTKSKKNAAPVNRNKAPRAPYSRAQAEDQERYLCPHSERQVDSHEVQSKLQRERSSLKRKPRRKQMVHLRPAGWKHTEVINIRNRAVTKDLVTKMHLMASSLKEFQISE